MQWRSKTKNGVNLYVEAAHGAGPRYFFAVAGKLQIRLPIDADVTDERVLVVMTRQLEAKVYELLERLTATN